MSHYSPHRASSHPFLPILPPTSPLPPILEKKGYLTGASLHLALGDHLSQATGESILAESSRVSHRDICCVSPRYFMALFSRIIEVSRIFSRFIHSLHFTCIDISPLTIMI